MLMHTTAVFGSKVHLHMNKALLFDALKLHGAGNFFAPHWE